MDFQKCEFCGKWFFSSKGKELESKFYCGKCFEKLSGEGAEKEETKPENIYKYFYCNDNCWKCNIAWCGHRMNLNGNIVWRYATYPSIATANSSSFIVEMT